jgi:hypothetical protein
MAVFFISYHGVACKTRRRDVEMPDEEKDQNVESQDGDQVQASAETKKTEQQEHLIPKSRLDEEIQKRKDLEKRLAAQEKAGQEAETKRLKEAEDYKALYEKTAAELSDAKPKAEKLEAYETTLKETLASAVEEIPADRRGLIPDELSTEAQLRWISRNRALLSKSPTFDIGAGKKGGGAQKSVELTQDELDVARNFGMNPDDYARYKDKPTP